MTLKVEFQLHGGQKPTKAHDSDSGWDLYACINHTPCAIVYDASGVTPKFCGGGEHDSATRIKPHGPPHVHLRPGQTYNVFCGVAVNPPPGWGYTVRGRSSLNLKGIQTLLGTVDSGFTGKLFAMLHNGGREDYIVRDGDRVAQIVFEPVAQVQLEEVTEFTQRGRGDKAFGSSGR